MIAISCKNDGGRRFRRNCVLGAAVLATLAVSFNIGPAMADSQSDAQATTEQVATKLTTARPYPLSAMNDSSERTNLTERLLRMNDPNKIGYVTLLTQNGQVLASFTIKGKVSSTGSQLTNTQNIESAYSNSAVAVDSMGDDGSYGPEEGGDNGIFFFTTAGVLIEYNGLWSYSDAPQVITTAPIVVLPMNSQPTSTAHILGSQPALPVAPQQ